MGLNSDLSKRVVISTEDLPWDALSTAGVQQRLLAQGVGEHAWIIRLVRCRPGAVLSHTEFLQGAETVVLDGELVDEHGVYPAGTYLKTPKVSEHALGGAMGCTLFIRRFRLEEGDSQAVVVPPENRRWHPGLVKGLDVLALDPSAETSTAMVRWAPGTRFSKHQHSGGEEILVLEGTFQDEHGDYPRGTWIRSPHLSTHQPFSEAGCLVFVKVGHLI